MTFPRTALKLVTLDPKSLRVGMKVKCNSTGNSSLCTPFVGTIKCIHPIKEVLCITRDDDRIGGGCGNAWAVHYGAGVHGGGWIKIGLPTVLSAKHQAALSTKLESLDQDLRKFKRDLREHL